MTPSVQPTALHAAREDIGTRTQSVRRTVERAMAVENPPFPSIRLMLNHPSHSTKSRNSMQCDSSTTIMECWMLDSTWMKSLVHCFRLAWSVMFHRAHHVRSSSTRSPPTPPTILQVFWYWMSTDVLWQSVVARPYQPPQEVQFGPSLPRDNRCI